MAIESVSSATFTPPQPRTEQSTQTGQANQAGQTEQSRQASAARPAERTNQNSAAAETPASQPVVNTQGQMTGRVINAIA